MADTRNDRRRNSRGPSSRAPRLTKTITVEVERTYRHARYGKFVRRRKRYLAHDEGNTADDGDIVELAATRPLSEAQALAARDGHRALCAR